MEIWKKGILVHDTGSREREQPNPMHLLKVESDETEYKIQIHESSN